MSGHAPSGPSTSVARSLRRRTIVLAGTSLLVGATLQWTGPAWGGPEAACGWHMTSVSKDGKASRSVTGDWPARGASVSPNGRYVLFSTDARLTGNDDDSRSDVFLRDLREGTISLVGRGRGERDPAWDSWDGAVTNDGRFILFSTGSLNVHPAANGHEQIYRRNLESGRVDLVSRSASGAAANVSTGGGHITPDGRFVAFTSQATNLGAPGDRNNAEGQVYVRDMKRDRLTLVSVGYDGRPASFGAYVGGVSADGTIVAFASQASNIVRGDTNQTSDVFVRNLRNDHTVRISKERDGSETGHFKSSSNPMLTPNGRYVLYTSLSPRIVKDDTNGASDAFVYDRQTERTVRVSVGTDGKQANGDSEGASISNDGAVATFISTAGNLDKRTSQEYNGFAHDRDSGRTRLYTICDDGTETVGFHNPGDLLAVSGNRDVIVAATQSSNWAPESSQGPQFRYQIYHRDFDIRPPTVLTTGGPYTTDPGVAVDLTAIARKPNGDPRADITVRFVVTKRNGDVVWSDGATTDGTGSATVTHVPSLDVRRYVVTAIVPATPTHARAETVDELAVGL